MAAKTGKIRVMIVDDHPMVREGLKTFLEIQEDILVAGEAADGESALAAVERARPDVILMDLVLPGMDGITAIRRIKEKRPGIRIVALTSFSDDDKVFPAFQAGACGYLLKDVTPAELVETIRAAHRGEKRLHPRITEKLMDSVSGVGRPATPDALSPREREVLACLGKGMSNQEIGEALFISEKTVKTHVSSILSKLGLSDRTQAALYAVRRGLA